MYAVRVSCNLPLPVCPYTDSISKNTCAIPPVWSGI